MSFRLRVRGLDKLIKKTDPKILNQPLADFFQRAGLVVEREGKLHAPVETGRLRNSLNTKVDSANPPMWVKVGSNVSNRGFPYGAALDAGGRTLTYNYRAGVPKGASGSPTVGWFTEKSVKAARDDIRRYAAQAEKDIRREWERG